MLPLASEKKKINSVSFNQPIKSLDKAILGSIATKKKNTEIIHLNIYKNVSCLMFRKTELPSKVFTRKLLNCIGILVILIIIILSFFYYKQVISIVDVIYKNHWNTVLES